MVILCSLDSMFKKFDKETKYLIACSGGPDSMALLDMYYKKDMHIEVAHVNYHKRQTALRDQNIVKDYCDARNIVFNLLEIFPEDVKGNFQAYARKVRYEFFAEICAKHNLDLVLVAHQQDDLIETYLMQKAKKIGVKEYGLAGHNEIYGAKVYRPLLDNTKAELIKYCDKNKIPYGVDESNLESNYTRNKIRHNDVEKMSREDRLLILNEIIMKNIEYFTIENDSLKYLYSSNVFDAEEFVNYPNIKSVLRNLFNISMSDKYLDEIIRQLKHNTSFKLLRNNIYLVKEYGLIKYFNKPEGYSFKVKYDEYFNTDYFKIQKSGKDSFSCAKVDKDDYPLTIRNYREGDCIAMKYGTKKINRFFIDHKISLQERLTWPIVLNKNNTAILVPGLGCDKFHYDKKPNIYVIKL